MIDGNISMEEDTELRDLVVQTLENNGILAKVRAELRASVFLTLEEQESILSPQPFLNNTIKQYLARSEGKLLFSLVREFLEYFGLEYTIAVYDPETYFGKEYNYVGRKKLCEELGINSKEPLLGEILKNTINGALNKLQKNDYSNTTLNKTDETSENFGNATFDVSVPKILNKDSSSISIDSSDKIESPFNLNLQLPINVTITDKKQNERTINKDILNNSNSESFKHLINDTENNKNLQSPKQKHVFLESASDQIKKIDKEPDINVNHNKLTTVQLEMHPHKETYKNKKSIPELKAIKNKKPIELINNSGNTVYFDEIIVDGVKEKISGSRDGELLLGELPPLQPANNSVFGDLPPLNGKKADMSDLKELMDIAQGVSQYDEDFASSASGSANEQSPAKVRNVSRSPSSIKIDKEEFMQNIQSENESEEIDEEIPSSISCLENIVEKKIEKLTITAGVDYME